jgi:hypothetical protein
VPAIFLVEFVATPPPTTGTASEVSVIASPAAGRSLVISPGPHTIARQRPGGPGRSSLPAIVAANVLPVGVGLASGATEWTSWGTGTLPAIAAGVGGAWLGHAVALGAVVSTAGLFASLLLTNSRLVP